VIVIVIGRLGGTFTPCVPWSRPDKVDKLAAFRIRYYLHTLCESVQRHGRWHDLLGCHGDDWELLALWEMMAVYFIWLAPNHMVSLPWRSNLGFRGFISSRLLASCHLVNSSAMDCCAPTLGWSSPRPEVPHLNSWSRSGAWSEWRTRWQDLEILESCSYLQYACVIRNLNRSNLKHMSEGLTAGHCDICIQ
jgi:hypothetical protein